MANQDEPPHAHIFHSIETSLSQQNYKSIDARTSATGNVLIQAQKQNPTIENLTYRYYIEYWRKKFEAGPKKADQRGPAFDVNDLWKSLYQCQLKEPNDCNRLARFLNRSSFPTIHLGKLDRKIPLRLLPGNHHLEDMIVIPDDHHSTPSGAMAVKYDNRHTQLGTSPGSRDDSILRRFKEVGSVLMCQGVSGWDETGHVLVIDMGEGRNRHPWIILTSERKRNVEFDYWIVEAHQNIGKNDYEAPGVFPGYRERTTIARLKALSPSSENCSLPSWFGPDFSFALDDHSKPSKTSQGPELARIMPWLRKDGGNDWDEVCYFDEDGEKEYMRYDARSHDFTYTESAALLQKQIEDSDPGVAPFVLKSLL
ncbi:MAG: hypothetical protein Q9221_005184 [Calogaya cf. arnoldii]